MQEEINKYPRLAQTNSKETMYHNKQNTKLFVVLLMQLLSFEVLQGSVLWG